MQNQRIRSPRYPSSPLQEAVRMARQIYEEDGMNAVDRETAVKHLGYSTMNGASATALASLKQFGLTADAGKGVLRLTDLALDLIEPESEDARREALVLAAYTPDLFASLKERFPEKVPSESNLRAHLVRQNFTPAAVKSIVPAYLATCEYIASVEVSESHGIADDPGAESGETPPSQRPTAMITSEVAAPHPAPETQAATPTQSGVRRMVFDTEEGEATFTYPSSLSEESVEDLEEWFALVTKRLRRATKG